MSRRRRVSEEGDIFEAEGSDEDERSIASGEVEEAKKPKEGNFIRIEKRPVSEADDSRIMKDGDYVECEESDANHVKESTSEMAETANQSWSDNDDTGWLDVPDHRGDSNDPTSVDIQSRKSNPVYQHDLRVAQKDLIKDTKDTKAMFSWSDKPETLISGTLNQQYTSEGRAKEDQRNSSWDFDGTLDKWGHDNFEALANGQSPLPPSTAWARNSGHGYPRRQRGGRGSPRRFGSRGRGGGFNSHGFENPSFPDSNFRDRPLRHRHRRPGRRQEYQSAERKKSDFDVESDSVDNDINWENIAVSGLSDEDNRPKRSARFSKM